MLRGVVDEPLCGGACVVPQHSSRLRVEGEGVVGGSDELYSVNCNWSDSKATGPLCVKNPLGAKLRDIAGMDFAKRAVAPAGVVAIVGEPVGRERLGK